MSRVPLAWLILTGDRRRFAMALLGVAFAVFLMFIELGFMNGVYDSVTLLYAQLDADLFVVNRMHIDVTPTRPFPRERVERARGFAGVAAAWPLYLRLDGQWRTSGDAKPYTVRVLAYDPAHPVWSDPAMNRESQKLLRPETCLVDTASLGPYARLAPGARGELQGKRIQVAGHFRLGTDLVVDGTVVTSASSYARYLGRPGAPEPGLDRVELGLVKLEPGVAPEPVARALRAGLGDDVDVLDRRAAIARVQDFWKANQPVGAVFATGMVVGFLIGIMTCYQVLFTEILDHLPQYATLKAIGYGDRYLVATVLKQSLYLGLSAFAAGGVAAWLVYGLLRRLTGIEMVMTPGRALALLPPTLAMCAVAGLIAMRKALQADPAEVF